MAWRDLVKIINGIPRSVLSYPYPIGTFFNTCIENTNRRTEGRNDDLVILSEEPGRILQRLGLQLQCISSGDTTSEQPDVIRQIVLRGTAETGKSTDIEQITRKQKTSNEQRNQIQNNSTP
jgi:hypothetical protein